MDGTHRTRELSLESFGTEIEAAVIGATGGIGGAFVDHLEACPAVSRICGLSRSEPSPRGNKVSWLRLDITDEGTIADAAAELKRAVGALDLVIVATGILHDGAVQPEKSWRAISASAMEHVLHLNTIGPALVAKHFLPLLARDKKAAFAALSARVGSIGDNELGGWYAYRASKAALNMMIKSLSIELARRNPSALCVALHPGTVDTGLSKPFQGGVSPPQLFSAMQSTRYLLNVLEDLTPERSGGLFAWDGTEIPF